MALVTEVGSFAVNTSTGDQTITLSNFSGITPKALIVWWMSSGTAVSASDRACGIGLAAGSGAQCCLWTSEDNQGVSDTGNASSNQFIRRINSDLGADTAITFSSFGTNQFVVNIANAPASSFDVYFIVLGGDDLTDAEVVSWNCPASTGSYSITGAGFTPTSALSMSLDSGNLFSAGAYSPMIALWDGTNEVVVNARGRDNQDTSDTYRDSSADALKQVSPASAIRYQASFTQFNSDGAEVNFSSVTSGRYVFTLFLQGGSCKVGTAQSPTSAGNVDSALGFPGSAAFYVSNGGSYPEYDSQHAVMTIGASDGSNHYSQAFSDEDNLDTTNVVRDGSTSHSLMILDPQGNRDDSATTSFPGNDLRTAFDVADATQRMYAFMAFGDDYTPASALRPNTLVQQAVNRAATF